MEKWVRENNEHLKSDYINGQTEKSKFTTDDSAYRINIYR